MPKRPPPPEVRIKPGTTRNPKGSSAKARARAAIKRMELTEAIDIIQMGLRADKAALKEVLADPNASAHQILVVSILKQAINKGDVRAYMMLLERIFGSPKTHSEVTGKDGGPIERQAVVMTLEEKLAEAERLRKIADEVGDD